MKEDSNQQVRNLQNQLQEEQRQTQNRWDLVSFVRFVCLLGGGGGMGEGGQGGNIKQQIFELTETWLVVIRESWLLWGLNTMYKSLLFSLWIRLLKKTSLGPFKVFSLFMNLNALFRRDSTIKDLETSLQQKKDDITRFEAERTELIAKVQRSKPRWSKIINLCITKSSVWQTIFLITPVIVNHMKKKLDIMKPHYSGQILPVPWPYVISTVLVIYQNSYPTHSCNL